MRQARAFFFVCAGIFLLALAYHLGARSAGAQGGGTVECVGAEGDNGSAVVNHHLYVVSNNLAPSLLDYGEVPSPAKAVACGGGAVVLEDGSVYVYGGHGWEQQGGLLPISGPTAAQSISIGQLKAKYATPAPAGK
jgi:hypothetical protein